MSLEYSRGGGDRLELQNNQAVLALDSSFPIKQTIESVVRAGLFRRVKRFGPEDGKIAYAVVCKSGKKIVQTAPFPVAPDPLEMQMLPQRIKNLGMYPERMPSHGSYTARASFKDVLAVFLTHEGIARIYFQTIVKYNLYHNSSTNPFEWQRQGEALNQKGVLVPSTVHGNPLIHVGLTLSGSDQHNPDSFVVTDPGGFAQFAQGLTDVYVRAMSK